MTEQELKDWTKRLVVRLVGPLQNLPRDPICQVYVRQLARCSSSVAANYRSACRGRSDAEMAAKLGLVEEEADESQLWIEIIQETGFSSDPVFEQIHKEYGEIVAIMVASRRTLRTRIAVSGSSIRETARGYDESFDETDDL